MPSPKKLCSVCGETKPTAAFHADKSRRDGLQYRCKACRRLHYKASPERAKQISREWQQANPERCLENSRRWREVNRDHKRAANQKWRESNLEKARAVARNYQHRRRLKTSVGSLNGKGLLGWEAAQKKICHWCGGKCAKYHVDHIVPLARGGTHSERNLAITCPSCNLKKNARDPVEFARSLGKLI